MSLKVSTRFPGGNAADIEIIEEGPTPEVRFASDPVGGAAALWFYFRLTETAPDPERMTKVRLIWKHFDSAPGGVSDSPACLGVSQPAGQGWSRLRQGEEIRLPDGQRQLAWWIPHPAPTTDVAFCFPYGASELGSLLDRSKDYWQTSVIGLSQGGRQILRVHNSLGNPGSTQPGIFLMARQHAGETPGSWVLDGILRHMAQVRKAGYVMWAVPFADPDGVVRGHHGRDAFPFDLDGAWGRPPLRHEAAVIRADLLRWKMRCRPLLALDLQSPRMDDRDGVCALCAADPAHPMAAEETKWSNVFQNELQAEFASPQFRRPEAAPPAGMPQIGFTEFVRTEIGIPALKLLIPYGLTAGGVLTQKSYREIGRRIALGIFHRHG